ncbi:helix-turn-helix domain-containing protein [Tumebacillus lipolyticus]|uniref:Tetratricopeptide repeat protein n=1 Tax=Tumebacillus lipolyticus TaxID=1280370 RepID=A0ABW4ZYW9_9BACL
MKDCSQETLGLRIRRLRLEKGMTQGELADRFVTISMISQVESGKSIPSVELIQHLAQRLQISMHELMSDKVDQMESSWQHQLAKAYLLAQLAAEAETIFNRLLASEDRSQAQQIELMIDLAESLYLQKKNDQALQLLRPLLAKLEQVRYEVQMLRRIHYVMGNVFYQIQKLQHAYYHYRRAYDLSLSYPNFDELAARISYQIGITLQLQDDHPEAARYLERAYQFYSCTDNWFLLASVLFAQGVAHKGLQEHQQARDLMIQALNLFQAADQVEQAYLVRRTIAFAITTQESPHSAIQELLACLRFAQQNDLHSFSAGVFAEIAEIQIQEGNLADARSSLASAQQIIWENDLLSTQEAAKCYKIDAQLQLLVQNYSAALENASKSLNIFTTNGSQAERVESLQIAHKAFQEQFDRPEADAGAIE